MPKLKSYAHLTRAPHRIVSLAPNVTSILCAIGARRQLVGITRWCPDVLPNLTRDGANLRKLPLLGDCWHVESLDTIAKLRPSLIIGSVPFHAEAVQRILQIPAQFLALYGFGMERNRANDQGRPRSEEHTSELQSHSDLVCRLLLEKKKKNVYNRDGLLRSSLPDQPRRRGAGRVPVFAAHVLRFQETLPHQLMIEPGRLR